MGIGPGGGIARLRSHCGEAARLWAAPHTAPEPQASDLDTGTFKASTTTVILYVIRLVCRVDNYVTFLLQYDRGAHDSARLSPHAAEAPASLRAVAEAPSRGRPTARAGTAGRTAGICSRPCPSCLALHPW